MLKSNKLSCFKFLLLSFLFNFIVDIGFSQKPSYVAREPIEVYKNTLFTGKPNLVNIYPPGDSSHKLTVSVSQGIVGNFDSTSGMYLISVSKPGKAVIKVYEEKAGKKILLYTKSVLVKIRQLTKNEKEISLLKIKPELSLAGKKMGSLSLAELKKATEFEINDPYKIISMTVYFGGQTSDVTTTALEGNQFTENFMLFWKRLGIGSTISLDNIKIMDKSGKMYELQGMTFFVSGDQ